MPDPLHFVPLAYWNPDSDLPGAAREIQKQYPEIDGFVAVCDTKEQMVHVFPGINYTRFVFVGGELYAPLVWCEPDELNGSSGFLVSFFDPEVLRQRFPINSYLALRLIRPYMAQHGAQGMVCDFVLPPPIIANAVLDGLMTGAICRN